MPGDGAKTRQPPRSEPRGGCQLGLTRRQGAGHSGYAGSQKALATQSLIIASET